MAATRKPWRWKALLRSVHIHLSLFGLILMLFFAVTGFMMNHEDWFEGPERTETILGEMPVEWLAEPDRLAIVEHLRADYGAQGRLSDFEIEDEVIEISFRKPGRTTNAEIFREDGYMTVEIELEGLFAAVSQLHMGKRSGTLGGLMVDLGSIILALAALSGIVLWTTLPARRMVGVVSVVSGILLAAFAWWYLVL